MSDASRRFGGTLWSLVLALLNATLVLLAVCLWFGWKMVSEARALSAGFAANLSLLQPLQTEVLGMRAEVAGLRADLAALQVQADPSAATTALAERVGALDARMSTTADRVNVLLDDPGVLIDRAVDRAAMQIKAGLTACAVPGT